MDYALSFRMMKGGLDENGERERDRATVRALNERWERAPAAAAVSSGGMHRRVSPFYCFESDYSEADALADGR